MTAINLTLPMINCSSCGSVIGHLIPSYKMLLPQLLTMINSDYDYNLDNDNFMIMDGITATYRNIYTSFIQVFYKNADDEDKKLFDPRVILIYALLDNNNLNPSDFPFRNIVKRYKWCCTRMFLCDPTEYI